MNIGQVYIVDGKAVMPLSPPDLDGYFLQIEIPLDNSTMGNNPTFEGAASFMGGKTLNVRRANEFMERVNNNVNNLSVTIANTKDNKTYVSTYVPISTTPLSIGDDFVEIANNTAYTVFGFFSKEVAVGAGISGKTVTKLYPYGINVQPVMEYIDMVSNKKFGLSELCKDNDISKGLTDTAKKTIQDMAIQNSRLPFAAVGFPKPNNLLYVKQDKPQIVAAPIQIKKYQAAGNKFVTNQPVDNAIRGWDDIDAAFDAMSNRLSITFTKEEKRDKYVDWQMQNFIAPQFPALPVTGNLLFDEFAIIQISSLTQNDNYLGIYDNDYALMPKKQPNALKYNLGEVGYHSSTIDVSYDKSFEPIDYYRMTPKRFLNECVKMEDYAHYSEVIKFGTTYQTNKSLTRANQSLISLATSPIIHYFGAGKFSCLQNNEQPVAGDMFGVGDLINITAKGSDFKMIVLYMYYALDKKQNKKKICVCANYKTLGDLLQSDNTIALFDIEADWLEQNSTSHTSFFEVRKKIKDFYLQSNVPQIGSSVKVSPYKEYKDLLGEEYDDEFLSAVSQLDWMKISELQKKNPQITTAIKRIISEFYILYLKEKAKRPVQAKEEQTEEINHGKYFFDLGVINNEKRIYDVLEAYIKQELGDEVMQSFVFSTPYEPTAVLDISLDDVPKYMNTGMGILNKLNKMPNYQSTWHNNSQSIVFQEKQEPALAVIVKSMLDSDSEMRFNVKGWDLDIRNVLTSRTTEIVNYYHWATGDRIMFFLVSVNYVQNESAFPEAKGKKIFPLVLTDYAINRLRYMNRWGLFGTTEEFYDRMVNLIKNAANNFYRSWSDLGFNDFHLDLFVSHSTSIAYDRGEKVSEFIKSANKNKQHITQYLINNKQQVIDYLNSLPIDWGNREQPYMEISSGTPAPVAPVKKRKAKTTTPEPTTPEPTTPTAKIELDYNMPVSVGYVGMLTEQIIKDAQMAKYNKPFSKNIAVRLFRYPLKNGGASELYNLRIDIPLNQNTVMDDFVAIDGKVAEFGDAGLFDWPNLLDAKYEGWQEHHNKLTSNKPDYFTLLLSVEGYDNFQKLNAAIIEYFQNISKGTSTTTTTTTTPTTGEFQWIKKPWQPFTSAEANEKYREVYGTPKDKKLEFCSFTAGYPTPNDPPKTIFLLKMPFSESMESLYFDLVRNYEFKVEWDKLSDNYSEIEKTLLGIDNTLFFFEEDLVNVITDIVKAIGMPLSGTTTTATKPEFQWTLGNWAMTLDKEDREALNYKYDTSDDVKGLFTVVKIGEQKYHIYVFDDCVFTKKFNEIDNAIKDNVKVLDENEKQKIYDEFPDSTDELYAELTDFKAYWVKEEDDNFTSIFKPILDKAKEEYRASLQASTQTTAPEPTKPTVKATKKTKEPKQPKATKPTKTTTKKGKLSPEELSSSLDDIDLDF